MALPVVFLTTDLSSMTLVADGATRNWTAPPLDGEQQTGPLLRQRVTAAAAWLVEQGEMRKRIGIACLDVNEGLCTWIQAPSAAPQVVHATLRERAQEWGESWIGDGVEVLTEDHDAGSRMTLLPTWMTRKKSDEQPAPDAHGPTAAHLPVISFPDAITRLWHDALDSRGVRVDLAMSLWHAAALVWPDNPSESEITATLLIESGHRIVWAWSRGDALVASGAYTIPAPDPDVEGSEPTEDEAVPGAQRLVLDWLTWSSQLGACPANLVLVGRDTDAWKNAITTQWPDMKSRCIREDDPTLATVTRLQTDLSSATRRERRSRYCITSLTSRPTRAVRNRYLVAGAALLLLAAAVGGLGYRFSSKAALHSARIDEVRSSLRSDLERLNDPEVLRTTNPRLYLEGQLLLKRTEGGEFREPYPPRPLLGEIERFLGVIGQHEDVKLQRLQISDTTNSANLLIEGGVPTKERVMAGIRESRQPGSLRWQERTSTDKSLNLNGEWSEP